MNMKNELSAAVDKSLQGLEISKPSFKLEYPENPEHGDFSCNAAMVYAKQLGIVPKVLAEKIIGEFKKNTPDFIESVSVAGPGFINFKIKDKVFAEEIVKVVEGGAEYGWGKGDLNRNVMVEYTDPNPFKVFHIGHLMSNAVGESISRLVEGSGAEVIRACYQGDVGLHVAKTIFTLVDRKEVGAALPSDDAPLNERMMFWGSAYSMGSDSYDTGEQWKQKIGDINKKIYERTDSEINRFYDIGLKVSLEYFDTIYKRLGTKFNQFFFESEVAENGIKVVREFLKKGIFIESEGAVVFKGEDHGLHTRVFITSQGLPTYEAKEIGLNTEKFNKYPDLTESIIVTANEQSVTESFFTD